MYRAFFRFYAELNDFLDKSLRFKRFEYQFSGKPSVKDAVEALGVPHTEVDLILVNSNPTDFSYHLRDGDYVSVYPVFESIDISTLKREEPLRELRFIADVHLGKLVRFLRILGFDTLYRNDFDDNEIIEISIKEGRVILTRDKGILKNGKVQRGYFVRSCNYKEQLKEVVNRFDLKTSIKPFERCMVCNGLLKNVRKEEVVDKLLPNTRKFYDEFKVCKSCGRIYWKGSHYKRIMSLVDEIKSF